MKKWTYLLISILSLLLLANVFMNVTTKLGYGFAALITLTAFLGLILLGISKKSGSGVLLLSVVAMTVYIMMYKQTMNMIALSLITLTFTMIYKPKRQRRKKQLIEPEVYEEEAKVEEYNEGDYVASKTGKTYHVPSCDWAKKIKDENKVWFNSEDEASKGRKPHSCIKS